MGPRKTNFLYFCLPQSPSPHSQKKKKKKKKKKKTLFWECQLFFFVSPGEHGMSDPRADPFAVYLSIPATLSPEMTRVTAALQRARAETGESRLRIVSGSSLGPHVARRLAAATRCLAGIIAIVPDSRFVAFIIYFHFLSFPFVFCGVFLTTNNKKKKKKSHLKNKNPTCNFSPNHAAAA
jgi:hypothetical protein